MNFVSTLQTLQTLLQERTPGAGRGMYLYKG